MKTLKTFFSSFRNAAISIVCAVVVLAAIGTGIALAAGAGKSGTVMDRKTAFGYALADAGVSEQEVTVTKQKLEKEKGEQYYEFDFFSKEYEYSYEIDAFTGAVKGVRVEAIFGKPSEGSGSMAAGNEQGAGQPEAGQEGTEGSGQGAGQEGTEGSGQSGQQGNPSGTEGSGQSGQQGNPSDAEGSGQGGQQGNQPGQNDSIDLETAKSIALADAGVDAGNARFTESELGWDDGVQVYEIEFFAGGAEHDYEINAVTGVILSRDAKGVWNSQNGPVDLETAQSLALADAGVVGASALFTESELDWDDGVQVYEIAFLAGSAEYDYEIDASTGAILEKGMKLLRNGLPSAGAQGSDGNTAAGSGYIGADQARAIAASHAGFETSDVVFTKTELEQEDGYAKYEVEFRKDRTEYEYDIDALTGSILEHESEYE